MSSASPVPAAHRANRTIVDECLDQLRSTCIQRIREAFEREQSIIATQQTRRFEAITGIYEGHYMEEYERHIEHDDFLSQLGGAMEGLVKQQLEDLAPGHVKAAMRSQDFMGTVRMKIDPAEGRNREALKLMAEVRSYYDCK
jgi:hypothetical protein